MFKGNYPLHSFCHHIDNKALRTNRQCHLNVTYNDAHTSDMSLFYELVILFSSFISERFSHNVRNIKMVPRMCVSVYTRLMSNSLWVHCYWLQHESLCIVSTWLEWLEAEVVVCSFLTVAFIWNLMKTFSEASRFLSDQGYVSTKHFIVCSSFGPKSWFYKSQVSLFTRIASYNSCFTWCCHLLEASNRQNHAIMQIIQDMQVRVEIWVFCDFIKPSPKSSKLWLESKSCNSSLHLWRLFYILIISFR